MIIFSGGYDIDPKFYDEEPTEGINIIDAGRDEFEIMLAKMALKEN